MVIPDPRPQVVKDTGINVTKYVADNFKPYNGDDSFLVGPTQATTALWSVLEDLCCKEREKVSDWVALSPKEVTWIWQPRTYLLIEDISYALLVLHVLNNAVIVPCIL